jgi:hypothetical protein
VAALLAFEAGPATAGPAFDLGVNNVQSTCDNIASPSSCTLNFYALPGTGAASQTVTMTAGGTKITGTQIFGAAPSGFSGNLVSFNNTLAAGGTRTNSYGFTGAVWAGISGQTTTSTGTASVAVTAGAGKNGNSAQTSPLTFNGITVAPIQSVGNTNAGFVLVGSSATATVTVTNKGHGNLATGGAPSSVSNLNGTVGAGSSAFVGGGGKLGGGSGLADGASQAFSHTFTPTVQATTLTTANITTAFANGNASGSNGTQTVTSTLTGQGVAPVNQVSSVSPVLARAGGSAATSTVTITNIGNGNLATGSLPNALSNLNGGISAITGTNWTGGANTFSIQDNSSPGSTSKVFTYQYAPQAARGSSSSGAVTIGFTNGNSNLSNTAQSVPVTLVGNTVGPIYQSTWPGTTVNTPGKNGGPPVSNIAFGTVAAGSNHSQVLTLANISTDPNGGISTLTDLSIESFTITGKNPSNFAIAGKQSGTGGVAAVLHEAGGSETVTIDFSAAAVGSYDAMLTLSTDEGAAFGGLGNTYVYELSAFATALAPEPASLLLLSVGIGGVLVIRRRRQRH